MYELATIGLLLGGAHVAAVYLGTDVLRLEYAQMMALNVGVAVVISMILSASSPSWKPKLKLALKKEALRGQAFADVGLMFLMFILASAGSAMLLYDRYGPVGWLGMVGASALVNWLV